MRFSLHPTRRPPGRDIWRWGSKNGTPRRRDLIDRPRTFATFDDATEAEIRELEEGMTTSETISVEELMRRRAEREAGDDE